MDFDFIEDEAVRAKAVETYENSVKAMKDDFQSQIDEAVSGLKTKNQELLDEKKQIQKTLKSFDDIDADKAREALAFLEGNDDAQLIKDGKIDELIEKRTSTMRSDHEAQISDLSTQLQEALTNSESFKVKYETKMVEDSLRSAALEAKVRTEAITDILLRGRNVFSLAEDGSVEARSNDGKLLKTEDDKVLTTSNWIESLKKSSPHYWPNSEGAGAHGTRGGSEGDITAALSRAAASGNMKEFKRLRAKQQGR